MEILLAITIIFLFYAHAKLRARVTELEKRNAPEADVDEAVTHFAPTTSQDDLPLEHHRLEPTFNRMSDLKETFSFLGWPKTVAGSDGSSGQRRASLLDNWFEAHAPLKFASGVFLFALGTILFLTVALDWSWPATFILFGFIFTLIIFGLGWYRRNDSVLISYPLLTALGQSIMIATLVFAHTAVELISLPLTLGLLLLSLLYTSAVAYCTKSHWLMFLSTLLGFCAPLILADLMSVSILTYVSALAISLAFFSAGLVDRITSALVFVGSTFYLIKATESLDSSWVYFTVVLITATVFLTYILLLLRSGVMQKSDGWLLWAVGMVFLAVTLDMVPAPALAVFSASLLVGLIGYTLTRFSQSLALVALCGALSAVGILVGFTILLTGASLVLTYCFLVTVFFLAVTYLGLPEKVLWAVSLAYALPVLSSFGLFAPTSLAWQTGVWHLDALALLVVAGTLIVPVLWLLHKQSIRHYPSSPLVIALLGLVGYVYLYVVIAQFILIIFPNPEAVVLQYVLWAVQTLAVIFYLLRQQLPIFMVQVSLATYSLPLLLSINSLAPQFWQTGVHHLNGFGVLWIILILILITLLLVQAYLQKGDPRYQRLFGFCLLGLMLYSALALFSIFSGVFASFNLSLVATYMSYLFILYILTRILTSWHAPQLWIALACLCYLVPILLSLSSLSLLGYPNQALVPEVVGLLTTIIILVMTAAFLKQSLPLDGSSYLEKSIAIKVFYGLAFTLGILLAWSLVHSFFTIEVALLVTLFVYTIIGLLLYLQAGRPLWRYVGATLLALVSLRLLVVEIWTMTAVGMTLTFVGVVALFIIAALFARPSRHELPQATNLLKLKPRAIKDEA